MANHGFGGPYARDDHFGGLTDDYARDGGWSGAGRADDVARDMHPRRISFRGRGPKNWNTDERIKEAINDWLTDHEAIDATDVEVEVANGEVTLNGTVGSRWQKRMAEDVAMRCRGVRDVHNRLRIEDRETQLGKTSE
jgi:osmotically-inducible protein OsmY